MSRLAVAKRNLISLLDALPDDGRFGLGVFAGSIDSLLILTPPRQVGKARSDLKSMVRSIQYKWTWDDNTSVQDALYRLALAAEKKKMVYGTGFTLIVLTDGEEGTGYTREKSNWKQEAFRAYTPILPVSEPWTAPKSLNMTMHGNSKNTGRIPTA